MGWVWRGVRRAVVGAIALSTTIVFLPAAPAVARGDRLPGIDVSKYQRVIDWRRVATTNARFAILRATLGNAYVDTKYRRNVAGATRYGLVVGAYHYAKPGRGRFDARKEANHFLRVARNAPGDILPVLDIEDPGGLGRPRLRRWALAWLRQVQQELGVRPMIYAGNSFWTRHMGNTPWFGRRGYAHWVAHWYVRRPDVPGRGWAGRGWTFWQWSANGRVPGIRGPVDLDWFGGRDLTRATIAAIRIERPVGGAIHGPRLSCGLGADACSRLASPGSDIVLRARPADGARLVRWTGACAGAATPTCRLAALGGSTVGAVFGRMSPVAVASSPEASVSAPEPRTARARPRRCRVNDAGCAVAAILSNAVAELREVLPVLPPAGAGR